MSDNTRSSPPFKITDELIDDLDDDFGIFRKRSEYADFKPRSKTPPGAKGGEIEFINNFIPDLDGASGEDPNSDLIVAIDTKSFHKTPRVKFWWPGEEKFKGCELADLLIMVTFIERNQVVERRSMLSQTKHTYDNKYKTLRKWDPNSYQFYLLHELPKFYPAQPDLGKWYELTRNNSSFSNYSFVSDFWLPFFHSTRGMSEDYIDYDYEESGNYHYDRTDDPPSGYQSLLGYLKLFIRGRFGQKFMANDETGHFYKDLFSSNKEFDLTDSKDKLRTGKDLKADGGFNGEPTDPSSPEEPPAEEDNYPSFGIVNIVVGKNSDSEMIDEPLFHFGDDYNYYLD
ncbi:hypothetical protein [Natrinema sp. H-ect4]|uniref:hypothetical protein n=1 Tax=Natrinema sp. H-ect4 TaxID=3242699 RepID=UPI0035A8FEAF